MLSKTFAANKDILGYKLLERIGSGGFGEVWSAVAPGGLMKAVKVVYGFHDEKHAQAELKALDRVKELRHPFLLSLERIEIYDGQLVVVTELADNSLADVFNEYIVLGETGIPRDRLIKFIRCAAEALDYISEEFGLQHLDIKPENLLMVGSHVKVADFGLIKDVQNSAQSLMSGMTPAYSPPELFDGRPGPKSDQYSLAIVYQEMLTGVKPFPGTTPAQLAAQHMHGKPNLRPLDKHEQLIIAKALAKDPEHRFRNCTEMVEELTNKKRTVKKAIRRTQAIRERDDTESQLSKYRPTKTNAGTSLISESSLPYHASDMKMLDVPECDADAAVCRPTLVVGLGSTANRIVQKVKDQLTTRHGSMEVLPAIKLLCVDADRNELVQLQRYDTSEIMMPQEILETPLKKPEVYRNSTRSHLSWLSRRWIYNVPRSLQTEGLRPLGRLAFADHFEKICERLQTNIAQMVDEQNLGTTADSLSLNPGKAHPRVVLLSSISGGIGSGMSIDMAYTIKLLLHEAGLPSECVTGIFMHSTYQRSRDPGLSAANAFAFLTELRHYIENGYPGDESIGIPEFDDEVPVEQTYFCELGSDLPQSEFDRQLDKVAEYVYLSSFSKCSEFFEACRKGDEENDHLAIRTFGISSNGPEKSDSGKNASSLIGRGLVRRWLQGDSQVDFNPTSYVDNLVSRLSVCPDNVTAKVTKLAHTAFDDSFRAIMKSALEVCGSDPAQRVPRLSAYLDGVLGTGEADEHAPDSVLQMEELVEKETSVTGDELTDGLLKLMHGREMNFHNALQVADVAGDRMKRFYDQLRHWVEECEYAVSKVAQRLVDQPVIRGNSSTAAVKQFENVVSDYCNERFKLFAVRFTRLYFSDMRSSVEGVQTLFGQYKELISRVGNQFVEDDAISADPEADNALDMSVLMNDWIEQHTYEHISKTEIQIYESLIRDEGGYIGFLNQPVLVHDQLGDMIRASSRIVLSDARKKISIDQVIALNGIDPKQIISWINQQVADARPKLDDCGGSVRLLVGLPDLSTESFLPEALKKQFHVNGKPIFGTRGNFVLCFEGEEIPFANVAYRLLETRPDAIELVKRIHTRNDVEWTSLNDLF